MAGRGGIGTGHDGDGEKQLRDAEDDGGDDPHLAAVRAARYCKATRNRLVLQSELPSAHAAAGAVGAMGGGGGRR